MRQIAIYLSFFLFFACNSKKSIDEFTDIVEISDLKEQVNAKDLLILDIRSEEEYLRGHIPNSYHFSRNNLFAEQAKRPYEKADKNSLAEKLQKVGLRDSHHLLIYDDFWGFDAAYLWWLCKFYGFKHVSVLNGGWKAWQKNQGEVEKNSNSTKPSNFSFSGESLVANIDHAILSENIDNHEYKLLDLRSLEEHKGLTNMEGASYPGCIPLSENLDAHALVDESELRFKTKEEITEVMSSVNHSMAKKLVLYSHDGSKSALAVLILQSVAGYEHIVHYDGSWIEWSYLEKARLSTANP